MVNKVNHIHRYHRIKLGKHIVFKCSIPNCSHYIRKELAEGRMSVCWRCSEPFIMTKAALDLKRPHCISCTKKKPSKVVKDRDRLKELLEKGLI